MTPTTDPTARLDRAILTVTAAAYAVVVPAPFVLSFASLAAWARDHVGLTGALPYVVPLALDASAVVCICLTFLAVMRADGAGAARFLVWLIAGGSAVANARHGADTSLDATILLAAMPLLTMLLVDIGFRRVLRNALAARGAIEPPLPRYRAVRWAIAPRETARAWGVGVREQITSPAAALAQSRRSAELTDAGVSDPAELAARARELQAMTKTDACRAAFTDIGEVNVPRAIAHLGQHGVSVNSNTAYSVARRVRAERPALAAVPTEGVS